MGKFTNMLEHRRILNGIAFLLGFVVASQVAVAHEDSQQDILDNFVYGDDVQAINDLKYTIETTCDHDVKCAFENVWAYMDITGDRQLSLAEIARFQRVMIKYWVVEQEQAEVNVQDIAGINLAAILLLPITSSSILHSFDYNNDGVLSPEEVLGDSEFAKLVGVDAHNFTSGIDFEGLGARLRNSLNLLPFLLE